MAKAKARPAPAQAPGMSSGMKALVIIAILMIVPFSLPTFILMFVTMLPTLVAALTDRAEQRYAWLSVGGLNFAGSAHWLFELWFGVYTIENAFTLVTDVGTLLSAWTCAGLGFVAHKALPPVAEAMLKMKHERRVAKLRDQQKDLIELWGPAVAKSDEDDD